MEINYIITMYYRFIWTLTLAAACLGINRLIDAGGSIISTGVGYKWGCESVSAPPPPPQPLIWYHPVSYPTKERLKQLSYLFPTLLQNQN